MKRILSISTGFFLLATFFISCSGGDMIDRKVVSLGDASDTLDVLAPKACKPGQEIWVNFSSGASYFATYVEDSSMAGSMKVRLVE